MTACQPLSVMISRRRRELAAAVVDDVVHLAEPLERRVEERIDGGALAHVALHRHDLGAVLGGEPFCRDRESLHFSRRDHDLRAELNELFGDRKTDPGAAPGDDRDAVAKETATEDGSMPERP